MTGKPTRPEAADRPAEASEWHARLEDCRGRLESVELLSVGSPRDALLLARALLDDLDVLMAALYPSEEAPAKTDPDAVQRARSAAEARQRLAAAEAAGAVPPDVIAALRRVVRDLARAVGRSDVRGLAAWRQALRRTTWLQAGIAAAVVVGILFVLIQVRAGRDRRAAEFETWFSQGSARLMAGDHAGAVERFRKAIAAMPDTDQSASAWNDMGWSLQQLGRYEEAIAAYRKALLLLPTFPLARNNLDAAERQLDLRKSEKERKPTPAAR